MMMTSRHASLLLVCAVSVVHQARAAEPRDPPGAPVVKLLNAGQEPRRALRYALAHSVSDRMTMDMTMVMQVKPGPAGGKPMPAIPPMRFIFDMDVSPDASERLFSYKYRIASVELVGDPQRSPFVETFEKQLAKIVGCSGSMTITSRGIIIESELDMAKGVDPQTATFMQTFEQGMRQLSTPLPIEPIGRGAVWETSTKVPSSGVILNQTTRYTITGLDGAHVAANVQNTQSAESQTFHPPQLRSGSEVHLESIEGKGQGLIDIDLSRLVATGTLQSQIEVNSKIRIGEKETLNSTTMTIDVTSALAR